jgi:hypothetical protein
MCHLLKYVCQIHVFMFSFLFIFVIVITGSMVRMNCHFHYYNSHPFISIIHRSPHLFTLNSQKSFSSSSILLSLGLFLLSESESYVTTDSQSASLSWYKAPIWAYDQIFIPVWNTEYVGQLRVC